MDFYGNAKSVEYFGKAWEKLTEIRKDMGGFILFPDRAEYICDENTLHLLGFEKYPSYKEFVEKTETVKNGKSGVGIEILHEAADETACLIFETLVEETGSFNFPAISQEKMVKAVDGMGGRLLLALVRFENRGSRSMTDACIFSALNSANRILPDGSFFAKHSANEYWLFVPDPAADTEEKFTELRAKIAEGPLTDEFGFVLGEENDVNFYIGAFVAEGKSANEMMHAASYALFAAISRGSGSTEIVNGELGEMDMAEYDKVKNFVKLLDENLFHYHFQPIISARSGEVIAYEALMRTDPEIGLNPLEILELAQRFDRLYDIEKATLFNTLEYLSLKQSEFDNKKLFINAIPSHLLTEEDFTVLTERYGELWEKVVVEMTEQTEIDDEELQYICARIRNNKARLAIDDYGTGYSNTSKLISFNPEYVKIDRSLIAGIDKDNKRIQILQGLVDFIHSNNGQVLGEGVETLAELETLMDLGCDLFQGFYISKPKPVPVKEISSTVRAEIERINLETTAVIKKVYQAVSGARVDMQKLTEDNVTDIFVGSGEYFFKGIPDQFAKSTISVKDNAKCDMYFDSVNLQPESGRPSIIIGKNSKLRLFVKNENMIKKFGIYVPDGSDFYLGGQGNLSVLVENRDCFAIGANSKNAAGNIVIDISGKLTINTNGEYCVGIGGGKTGGRIEIVNGAVFVNGSGGNCLGIGCIYGEAMLAISNCKLNVKHASARSCGIGSLEGKIKIRLRDMFFRDDSSGNALCGMGTLDGSYAELLAENVGIKMEGRGKKIINIGSHDAECECTFVNSHVDLYSEGESVVGIGDATGTGKVELTDTTVEMKFMTGNGFACGTSEGDAVITRGHRNISINS